VACEDVIVDAANADVDGRQRDRLAQQLEFIAELDRLKHVVRRTPLIDGSRCETDAEHSWEVALMAVVLAEHAGSPIDLPRVVTMLLIHDVVEIDAGDTFLYDDRATTTKSARERAAADRLFALLPSEQAAELRALWDEFEELETPEARFAKAMDRLQPLLHNYRAGGGTWKHLGVDHAKVTERKRIIGSGSPALWAYARELLQRAVDDGVLAA
jgi:putative hydrolase of HD superfamily